MVRTKVTPKRREPLPPWLLLHENRNRLGTARTYPYKIKLTRPKQKLVDIKKNSEVIKTINVCRGSKYFNSRTAN